MINKRLLNLITGIKSSIALIVVSQWIGFVANITITIIISMILGDGFIAGTIIIKPWMMVALAGCILIRMLSQVTKQHFTHRASSQTKAALREKLMARLLQDNIATQGKWSSSELLQLGSEGIEQLEQVVGRYYPQFFYCLLASLSLFAVLSFYSFPIALVLLVCLPMIPLAIVAVQKFAKKLLAKYWGMYTDLGDHFLENLDGLITLKVYQMDEQKAAEMDDDAEKFRKMTMRVLIMQLNSISIMDIIAYGGAALAILLSLLAYQKGTLNLATLLIITLTSAEFFIPLRQLGSFFHVAMNGNTASDKIFALLDETVAPDGKITLGEAFPIAADHLSFSYGSKPVFQDVSVRIEPGSFVAIVGESGSGKSTFAKCLSRDLIPSEGTLTAGSIFYEDIQSQSLMENICIVTHESVLFSGTVKDNLCLGKQFTAQEMIHVLQQVSLYDFIAENGGLDMPIAEEAANLSGGQRQRLALARALLRDSSCYIFDEATSNIDLESEQIILDVIRSLSLNKMVIMIAHRLKNVEEADQILVFDNHHLAQQGKHEALMAEPGPYLRMVEKQRAIEMIRGDYHA